MSDEDEERPDLAPRYEDIDDPEIAEMGRKVAENEARQDLIDQADDALDAMSSIAPVSQLPVEDDLPESVIPQLAEFVVDPGAPPNRSPHTRKVAAAIAAGAVIIGVGIGIVVLSGDKDPDPLDAFENGPVDAEQVDAVFDDEVDGGDATGQGSSGGLIDPTGNWLPSDDFDEIIPEREADGLLAADALSATDVVGVDLVSDGESTRIGVDHAGDAQAVEAHPRAVLRTGIVWVGLDGSVVDVNYNDGEVKITDKPSDWTIEALWETPERLVFVIDGVGIVPGTVVALDVFLSLFDGVNLQRMELTAS
jgi:hypothetical protein